MRSGANKIVKTGKSTMRSIKHMDELNSAKTLQEVSAKLRSYDGAKWCC